MEETTPTPLPLPPDVEAPERLDGVQKYIYVPSPGAWWMAIALWALFGVQLFQALIMFFRGAVQ